MAKSAFRLTGIGIASLLGSLLLFIGISNVAGQQGLVETRPMPTTFKGRILAASDADMLGGAYANGVLNKAKGVEDSLTFIEVTNGQPVVVSQEHVSNSVVSWPSIIAWHPGKQYAYVAETRGVFTENKDKVKDVWQDLPAGEYMTVVDLSDSQHPKTIQAKAIGSNIQGASVNAAGDLLVAGSTEPGKEIVICRLVDGKIQDAFHFTHDEVARDDDRGFRTMEFHPTDNVFSANLGDTHLMFFRIKDHGEAIELEAIGSSIPVAKHWSVGNWHPTGKYFIVSDVAWGKGSLGFITNGKGKLASVRFDEAGQHEVVSEVQVGRSPEGFDLSPDGQYAVAVNMRRTYVPPKGFWFVSRKKSASLTLVKIDPKTGALTRLGDDYGFEGMLPEDAIFDQKSNSIAIAIFHEWQDERPRQGWIDFWEVQNDELIKTDRRLYVTRGVHNLLLVN